MNGMLLKSAKQWAAILAVQAFLWTPLAFADGGTLAPNDSSIPLVNPLGSSCNDLSCPLNLIIDFLFTIAIPLCAIMVLIGGFYMVTSSGDPAKVTKGRKTILYAAGGFAVILLAKGVSTLITSFFTGT
jgi:hypothetical protein